MALTAVIARAMAGAGMLAVAAVAAPAPAVAQAQQAALVYVDTVRVEAASQTVPVIGRLVACRAGAVAARVDGSVSHIAVEVGDRVAAGDLLAELDRERYSAERDLHVARVAEARAAVAAVEAETALRQQELDRMEALRRSPAFSESRVDDKRQEVAMARGALGRARAAVTSAEAELRLAGIDLADIEIRAPYAGVVSRRHTEIGAHIGAGAPVVSLVADDCKEIEADVPAAQVAGLVPGHAVTFELSGSQGQATVRAVVPEENPLTRTRTARFVPALGDLDDAVVDRLASGQSLVIRIPAGAPGDALTVHKDAVITRRGQPTVFVVVDGKAVPRPVTLGDAIGERFRVVEGLAAGDSAVVRGNERLRPDQAVRIGEEPATAPPAAGPGTAG